MFIEAQQFLNMIAIHFDRNLRAQMFCLHRQNGKLFLFMKGMSADAQQQEFIIFSEYFPCWISGALSFSPCSSHALWKRFEIPSLDSTENTGLGDLFADPDDSPVQVLQKVKLTQLKNHKHTTKISSKNLNDI